MLFPGSALRILEYDAMFIVTPTSRAGHHSDTVLAVVEMLVENDQPEEIEFPFYIVNIDSGLNAASAESVQPHVLNGSQPVEVQDEEVDEQALADMMVERAKTQQGISDPRVLEWIGQWVRETLARAERVKIGRTRIAPSTRRRIILQQRIRLQESDGRFTLEVMAPPPIGAIAIGGRVSLFVIFPWEDEDVRIEVLEKTEGFEVESGRLKVRQWVGWHWRNDPVLRVVYRYL
jgi:hypothetical protein